MMKKAAGLLMALLLLLPYAVLPAAAEETTADTEATVVTTTAASTEASTTGEDTVTTTDRSTQTTTASLSGQAIATRTVIMELDGKIVAYVTDVNGNGLAGIPVRLQLGTTVMPAVQTDDGGYARYRYSYPADKTYIYCEALQTVIDGVTYKSSAASVGIQPHASTAHAAGVTTTLNGATVAASTTKRATTVKRTTEARKTTATAPVITYTAVGTTGTEDTFVSLGVNFDSQVLSAFECDEKDFSEIARLLLSQERYAALLDGTNGLLQLHAAVSASAVTDEHIAAALAEDAVLSRIDPADVPRVVLDLTMQLRDESGNLTDFWNVTNDTYFIQLPVPKSMRSAQSITVSAVTEEGISDPVIVNVTKDGYLRFESSLPIGTIVLLGFESGMLGALTSHAVRSSVIFLVIGVLCIVGAVLLFIFFVHTPRSGKKNAENQVTESMPIAPAEEELPPVGADNARIDPTDGLDIFADDAAPQGFKPKKPADYDIEL